MANVNINKAFTLLEMSITLTIIALLVAGVVTGQSMKHRQELNQIITDISTITSAVKQFKDTYSGHLPGDLYNATDLLGATTSNGDGTGFLETNNGNAKNEELLFWQHLQLAGLISGAYDGVTTGAGGLMGSQIKYGFYQAHKALNTPAGNTKGRLAIQVSKSDGSGLFIAKEAYDFDTKYDDGNPGLTNPATSSATISAADGTGATAGDCVTVNTSPTADAYNVTSTASTPCILYFYLE